MPGLYACGEVLDVDGDCGGYNLQWAWSSGRLAGHSAGKEKICLNMIIAKIVLAAANMPEKIVNLFA